MECFSNFPSTHNFIIFHCTPYMKAAFNALKHAGKPRREATWKTFENSSIDKIGILNYLNQKSEVRGQSENIDSFTVFKQNLKLLLSTQT